MSDSPSTSSLVDSRAPSSTTSTRSQKRKLIKLETAKKMIALQKERLDLEEQRQKERLDLEEQRQKERFDLEEQRQKERFDLDAQLLQVKSDLMEAQLDDSQKICRYCSQKGHHRSICPSKFSHTMKTPTPTDPSSPITHLPRPPTTSQPEPAHLATEQDSVLMQTARARTRNPDKTHTSWLDATTPETSNSPVQHEHRNTTTPVIEHDSLYSEPTIVPPHTDAHASEQSPATLSPATVRNMTSDRLAPSTNSPDQEQLKMEQDPLPIPTHDSRSDRTVTVPPLTDAQASELLVLAQRDLPPAWLTPHNDQPPTAPAPTCQTTATWSSPPCAEHIDASTGSPQPTVNTLPPQPQESLSITTFGSDTVHHPTAHSNGQLILLDGSSLSVSATIVPSISSKIVRSPLPHNLHHSLATRVRLADPPPSSSTAHSIDILIGNYFYSDGLLLREQLLFLLNSKLGRLLSGRRPHEPPD